MDNRYFRKAVYYETDQMGIVHHSNYIRYFEEARVFFMHNIGCDVKELEELGVIIPNVDAYAKYLKPIKFYDDFYVEVKLVSFTGVRMEFDNGWALVRFSNTSPNFFHSTVSSNVSSLSR